jgi:hypothetical protein
MTAHYPSIKLNIFPLLNIKMANVHVSLFTPSRRLFSPALILQNNSTIGQDFISKVAQIELRASISSRLVTIYNANPTRWRIFVIKGSV